MSRQSSKSRKAKPTILGFHGSGSNTTVHSVQLARIKKGLLANYVIESLNGPFPSAAGPGILPFFEGLGPYHRWIPASQIVTTEAMKKSQASGDMSPEVEAIVKARVQEIQAAGGRVAGVIGFSQGTRVVAGLLKGAEIRRQLLASGDKAEGLEWLDFDFGISVCGSYPPPLTPQAATSALASSSLSPEQQSAIVDAKISLPTLHVIGSQDEWSWAGQLIIEKCYDVAPGKSHLLHCDMGHHYPTVPEDTESVTDWIIETAQEIGR